MSKFTNLSSLVFNQPLLITQDYAETVAVVLSERLGLDVENLQINSGPKDSRQARTTSKGIRVIPIVGSMSHRSTGIEALSGMTSYASLKNQFEDAFNDPNTTAILMDIDSPGGAVAGAFDLRDYLMENKGRKPLVALARDTMCSAAYLLGSTADKLYATQTAKVGSIGVVAMHLDRSEKNQKEGIKPTFIHAGDYKVAGNPHEKLEGKNLEYLQGSVDEAYEMFVDAVAEARGIDDKVIRDTQARVYSGKKAVEIGLADGIRTYENLLREMSTPNFTNQGTKMSNETLNVDATELTALQASVAKLQSDNENLRAQVLAAGFTITADGLKAKDVSEMITVGDEQIDASTLPKSVVDALKEKADAELTSKATEAYPNLKPDVAKKLYSTFTGDADMEAALSAFDSKMGEMLEEKGNTDPGIETMTAQEKLDKAVADQMATGNMTYHQAYLKVANTDTGKQLIKDIYAEKE